MQMITFNVTSHSFSCAYVFLKCWGDGRLRLQTNMCVCVCVSLLINDKSAWEEELMFTKPATAKYSIRNLTFIHRLLWHNHRLCPKFSFQNKFTLGSNMFVHSFDFISSQPMSCWTHVHTHKDGLSLQFTEHSAHRFQTFFRWFQN